MTFGLYLCRREGVEVDFDLFDSRDEVHVQSVIRFGKQKQFGSGKVAVLVKCL